MMWDSVVRAPLWGSVLLSIALSLIGVILFIRKKTLVGEVLAHASYPGVTLAIFFAPWLALESAIVCFATLFALLGFWLVHLLQKELKIKEDAALCFVLATFFGMGTLIASIIQVTHPANFRQIPLYLYGQAATLQDHHLVIAFIYAIAVITLIIVLYRPLVILSFDAAFAKTFPVPIRWVDSAFILIVAITTILGMRFMGVILLSALMVAPACAARQYTNKLPFMLILAGLFGAISGFIGTLVSLKGLPTGPSIVVVVSIIALLSLCFAPKRGVLFCLMRMYRFKFKTRQENLIKALWHHQTVKAPGWLWFYLRRKGWVNKRRLLTQKGASKGAHIVRLHRLWEAYLVRSLGMEAHQVHTSAEMMEHVLTPLLEQELVNILDNPMTDPHSQPIPAAQRGGL